MVFVIDLSGVNQLRAFEPAKGWIRLHGGWMRKQGVLFSAAALVLIMAACGGGGPVGSPSTGAIVVSVSPSSATILVGTGVKISATVTGTSNTAVALSVIEPGGGQVSANGDYIAPVAAGRYHVRATSIASPTQFADATITVRDYSNKVSRLTNTTDGRDYHTASLLQDGSVLIVGGVGFSGVIKSSERYVPSQGHFEVSAELSKARIQHAAVTLANGKVLVAGGYNPLAGGSPFDEAFRSAEIYERTGDHFLPTADLNFPRRAHEMTLLKDGRVLVTGGIQLIGSGFGASPNAEIFDDNTSAFAVTGRMNVGRWLHTATLLKDGRVLIVGGRPNNCDGTCLDSSLATAEIFDPSTGTFTPTGSLNLGRFAHSATLLQDGRVLILGGETYNLSDSDQIATGEIYDPATGTFQTFGSLLGGRSHHTATLLNNGKYLLAGGKNWNGTIVGTTEIFDVQSGSSTLGPEMNEWRIRHTATRLLSGEVLIVGGNNSGSAVPVVDLYE